MPTSKDETMQIASMSVATLVDKIKRKEIRLPEMQRRYVWKASQVCDLLDSLYRGYPSGTILTWDTDKNVVTQEFAVAQQEGTKSSFELLLDGQQRLTSLSAILRGEPIEVHGRKRPIDILFNLDHPDKPEETLEVASYDSDADTGEDEENDEAETDESRMTFAVHKAQLAKKPNWVSVKEVLTTDGEKSFLKQAGVSDMDDERYDKYTSRLAKLRAIKKYTYQVQILGRENSYAEVTDMFVRINSRGTALRSHDLALAQITAKWPGSLKKFEKFEEECAQKHAFNVDMGTHIRNLVAFATKQGSFSAIGGLSREQIESAWDDAKRGMEDAITFLCGNHVYNPALLVSPHTIIIVALFRHLHKRQWTPEESNKLAYWVHMANVKGRYARGSSQNILNRDLGFVGDLNLDSMLGDLEKQVVRMAIGPEELVGRDNRSPYYKTMFMAFRYAGAKDWFSQNLIDLNAAGAKHKIESHHIFPQALLEGRFTKEKIDDICNFAFIISDTNKSIFKDPPDKYLPRLVGKIGEGQLQNQCIPTDPKLWQVKNYENFLAKRRALVADRLNEFLMGIKGE